MANVRKYGSMRPVKRNSPVRWNPGKDKHDMKQRQEVDNNAKTLGKQLRV